MKFKEGKVGDVVQFKYTWLDGRRIGAPTVIGIIRSIDTTVDETPYYSLSYFMFFGTDSGTPHYNPGTGAFMEGEMSHLKRASLEKWQFYVNLWGQ